MVTNALTCLSKVNKIVVLKDGSISEMGTYEELLERNGVFAKLIKQHLTEAGDHEEESDHESKFTMMMGNTFTRLPLNGLLMTYDAFSFVY